ncbi:hypothetical protein ACWT_7570 [Actinoplanes sp. SE50]|uniref:hypothetical protein n=1 Tax=unclassified Actinoplanes TaxID=2626549 RepID=UPI00023EDD32|nr:MULTISPECIES: hypothetical protein [unclassified Actinoplanes]AEV88580.1 hypothetical protein ACPL_7700 [Actinoplanes sp. SE50/110]ATO86985.1 hypothetical protein ACWT_7570 [Actinoplanes sp. SE50]SLM04403.1 hypothetical protein ACSP50_7708 [Actinoplanes sp. SE50/110]
MSAERDDRWPAVSTVLRVMAGWFLFGVGLLDLVSGTDGPVYVVFHAVVTLGGMILLALHRIAPSRAAWLVAALTVPAGLGPGLIPVTTRCCMAAHPRRRGFPFPFLGTGDGVHTDLRYLGADLVFWGCAGLVTLTLTRFIEKQIPERRTPVDLTGYVGRHAEAHAYVAQHRADENVGGLP